jgi:amino acid transporter
MVFSAVLAASVLWFVAAAVRALTAGTGAATLLSTRPFFDASTFSLPAVLSATPVAVLSFLGFDGISTLAEDARDPKRDVARATLLVCFVAGGIFILQTYLGQLVWPDYKRFTVVETAFSEIGWSIGGAGLSLMIAFLVIAQAWASGITSQASASRLMFGMARDGRLPPAVFGYLHPTLRTPVYSVMLMGAIAAAGALAVNLDQAADMVNFGACLGFMAVNLSVPGYYFRAGRRGASGVCRDLIFPGLGFVVCLLIWLSISAPAMTLGAVWTAAGLLYLAVQAHGRNRRKQRTCD